jgi:hypothetical protein
LLILQMECNSIQNQMQVPSASMIINSRDLLLTLTIRMIKS